MSINDWNKDKQIKKILMSTMENLIEDNIDTSEINNDVTISILDACYNPIYIATVWKLYKYLHETSKYSDNLFWITSGNSAGFFKYGGHIPWDDDIDIGFKINNNFDTYIAFLMECIKCNLIVNLHLKKDINSTANWYDNSTVVNLVLDSRPNPSWNFIKETEFRNLIKENPSKLYFANVTITEFVWKKMINKMGFENAYMWNNKTYATPWIDIIPHIQKNNRLIPHFNDNINTLPSFSTDFEFYDFLTVPGKFPLDLLQGLLIQYNEKRSYLNFLHWDSIFSHVKKTKIIINYKKNPTLHKFIKIFITKYNNELLYYINKISFNDLLN